MKDHTRVNLRGAPGAPDGDMARLTREDWALRAELTGVVNQIRLLEQRSRSNPLGAEDAALARALRSRESQLHGAKARGTAALRILRADAASALSAASAAPTG